MNDQSVLGKKVIPSVEAELLLVRLELPICRPCVFHFRVLRYDQSSEQGPGMSAVHTVGPCRPAVREPEVRSWKPEGRAAC